MDVIATVPLLSKIAISWERPYDDGVAGSGGHAVALSGRRHCNHRRKGSDGGGGSERAAALMWADTTYSAR